MDADNKLHHVLRFYTNSFWSLRDHREAGSSVIMEAPSRLEDLRRIGVAELPVLFATSVSLFVTVCFARGFVLLVSLFPLTISIRVWSCADLPALFSGLFSVHHHSKRIAGENQERVTSGSLSGKSCGC